MLRAEDDLAHKEREMRAGISVVLLGVAVSVAGTIVAWGDDSCGQVEDVPAGDYYTQIDAEAAHAVALRSNSIADAWGSNYSGEGTDPGTGFHFLQVDAGNTFNFGIKEDGYLYQWGDDSFVIPSGYLEYQYADITFGNFCGAGITVEGGIGSWGVMGSPPSMTNCIEVSAGGGTGTTDEYIAAIDEDAIVVWGESEMEFPSGEPNAGFIHVSAGYEFCVAVRSDGTLFAWGDDSFGQVSNLPAGSNFVDVAAGGYHGLAVTDEGDVVGWGRNDCGQCDVPVLPSDSVYTSVSAGGSFSMALREYSEPQGVEENASDEMGFRVVENPCVGTVSFNVQPSSSSRCLELYSLAGRRIDVQEVPAASEVIQWATGVPEGLYWAVLGEAVAAFTVLR